MGNTSISKHLNKSTSFLTKDGRELEGINYRQFKAGIQPTNSEPVVEETTEEKKARLLKELAELG